MFWKVRLMWHPCWRYLNQPVFEKGKESVWRPSRFWYFYRIQLLESCLQKDIGSESHYTQ